MSGQWRTAAVGVMGVVLVGAGAAGWMFHRHQAAQAQVAADEAETGRMLFRTLCAACHGPGGDGAGGAPILNDGQTVAKYPTVAALAGFIQTHMPASDPGILTAQESQDLAVWIRHLNHLNPSF